MIFNDPKLDAILTFLYPWVATFFLRINYTESLFTKFEISTKSRNLPAQGTEGLEPLKIKPAVCHRNVLKNALSMCARSAENIKDRARYEKKHTCQYDFLPFRLIRVHFRDNVLYNFIMIKRNFNLPFLKKKLIFQSICPSSTEHESPNQRSIGFTYRCMLNMNYMFSCT